MMSESHQRQLLLFGENPNSYLHDYSKQFEKISPKNIICFCLVGFQTDLHDYLNNLNSATITFYIYQVFLYSLYLFPGLYRHFETTISRQESSCQCCLSAVHWVQGMYKICIDYGITFYPFRGQNF